MGREGSTNPREKGRDVGRSSLDDIFYLELVLSEKLTPTSPRLNCDPICSNVRAELSKDEGTSAGCWR